MTTLTHEQLPARLRTLVPPAGLCLLFSRKEDRKGGLGGTTYLAKGLHTTLCFRFVRGRWRQVNAY